MYANISSKHFFGYVYFRKQTDFWDSWIGWRWYDDFMINYLKSTQASSGVQWEVEGQKIV